MAVAGPELSWAADVVGTAAGLAAAAAAAASPAEDLSVVVALYADGWLEARL